jgi:hypothetical protein
MGGERFTGVALLNIYKYISINVDDIISKFGKTKKRILKIKICFYL